MFKRILVVLEREPHDVAAIQIGVRLAKRYDAKILFHSGLPRYRPPAFDLPECAVTAHWDSLDDARDQADRVLAQAQATAEKMGVMSTTAIGTGDDQVRCIIDSARAARCDLITLATEGSNAVIRLLTGAIIPGLVTASPVPVLVCTPTTRQDDTLSHGEVRRILVMLEDHDADETTLSYATELARTYMAELIFAHVVQPELVPMVDISSFATGSGERLAAEFRARSSRLLEAARQAAQRKGAIARSMSLMPGTTSRDIASLAIAQGCDLIVVTHEGQSAVVRLLTGSLIPGLITSSTLPVLICRATKNPPSGRRTRRRRHRARAVAAASPATQGRMP